MLWLAASLLLGGLAMGGGALAQDSGQDSGVRETINGGAIGIVAGTPGETYIDIAADMSRVLDCVDGLRVLPIAGKGSVANIEDLLYLRGVDMAIVQADVLDYIEREGLFAADIKQRVSYIARLFDQEVHILARPGIGAIEDLRGRRVNVAPPGVAPVTADLVFDAAGIEVIATKYDQAMALHKLEAGEIDAMVMLAGKPAGLLESLPADSGLSLLPVARSEDMSAHYADAWIESRDYPNLIAEGARVRTVAVPTVLASFAWPSEHERYRKIETFVKALFERFDYLKRPSHHPKWQEASLTDTLAGWIRFSPAEAAADLVQHTRGSDLVVQDTPVEGLLARTDDVAFEAFLADFRLQPRDDAEKAELLRRFENSSVRKRIDAELAHRAVDRLRDESVSRAPPIIVAPTAQSAPASAPAPAGPPPAQDQTGGSGQAPPTEVLPSSAVKPVL